jgi:prophage regulatory protein
MMPRTNLPPDQEILYRMPEVTTITGKARSTVYREIAKGRFPAPVQLGAQSVAWRKSAIDRWMAALPPAAEVPRTRPRTSSGRIAKARTRR